MRIFRMFAGLVIFLCVIPPLVLVMAALAGRWTSCDADPDVPHACLLLGGDYGDFLHALAHFGGNTGAAILILAAVLVVWAVLEILHWAGGAPQKPKRQTPASSRNRKRGS